ncbi:RICIN domain-containing protein [Streptomyces sp. TRM72054]|uniref:RICIN domain-containing protein n=1 Tax=Streptomyces sp. TRM72054 TaxID=2870562 RepID=UPI001C8B5B05|nr:RICIN domain-containing protein [Streptomyces sp. TRM72054]MBX9399270.1 RICIN domain-containing protein [Streptomyces sp. TRM72054]
MLLIRKSILPSVIAMVMAGIPSTALAVSADSSALPKPPVDCAFEWSGISFQNLATGRVIDNAGGTHKDGNSIVSWGPNKQGNQKWGIQKSLLGGCLLYLDDQAFLNYVIREDPSNHLLKLTKYTSDDPSNRWKFKDGDTDGFMQIYNVGTGDCITDDVSAGGLRAEPCVSDLTRDDAAPVSDDLQSGSAYQLESVAVPGLAVDVPNSSKDLGVGLQLYAINHTGAQEFVWKDTGGGKGKLVNKNSGLCLEIFGLTPQVGAKIRQYTCHGQTGDQNQTQDDNQVWRPESQSNGDVNIVSKTGLALTAVNNDGHWVLQAMKPDGGDPAQRFRVTKFGPPPNSQRWEWIEQ